MPRDFRGAGGLRRSAAPRAGPVKPVQHVPAVLAQLADQRVQAFKAPLRAKKVTLNGKAVRHPEFSLENGVYEIKAELN